MTTWAEISDEHGYLTDDRFPEFVTGPATLLRWERCVGAAARFVGKPAEDPEVRLMADTLFRSDIPTGPADDAEPVALAEAQVPFEDHLHPRNRLGRFIDTPDLDPDPAPPRRRRAMPLRSPGTRSQLRYTEAEIAAAGLDKWPEKGERALEILGPEAKDTTDLFGPEEPGDEKFPEYATDRKAKWLALIGAAFAGKTPPDGEPHALFMAGGPASGKSTVLRENRDMLAPDPANTVHVDVDEIKERMHQFGMDEYRELREAGDHYAATAVHRETGDIAALMVKMAMDAGLNVIIDGTGNSDPGLFRSQLEEMRDAGYTVDALYVTRSTPESVSLAIQRAERSGRFVPVEVVREMHKKVSVNFRDEISHLTWLNSLNVYDAEGPIAEMGEDGKITPLEQERYDAFMAKADEQVDTEKLEDIEANDPLLEAAGKPVPIEKWSVERPHDSSEYLRRRGPWPQRQPQD